jgi:HEAT repeat protein
MLSENDRKLLAKELSEIVFDNIFEKLKYISIFGAVGILAGIYATVKLLVNERTEKAIEKLDAKRLDAMKAVTETEEQIKSSKAKLNKLSELEEEIKESLESYKSGLDSVKSKLDKLGEDYQSISDDLESSQRDFISVSEARLDVLTEMIDRLDMDHKSSKLMLDKLVLDLNGEDIKAKKRAIERMPYLTIHSKEAAQKLILKLQDESDTPLGRDMLGALSEIGLCQEHVPNLLRLADDVSSPNITAIIGALGKTKEQDKKAVSTDVFSKFFCILNEASGESLTPPLTLDDITRAIAIGFFNYAKYAGTGVIEKLIEMLGSEDWETKMNVAIALGEIGPRAIKARPALTRLKEDESPKVAKEAADALSKITGRN